MPDELEQQTHTALSRVAHRIFRAENGRRQRQTKIFMVRVYKMAFNWNRVVMFPHQQIETTHDYCCFGTGLENRARAIAAGLEWVDP